MKTAKKISFLGGIQHRVDGWVEGFNNRFSLLGCVGLVLVVWGLAFLYSVGCIFWWVCGLGVRGVQ